MKNYTHVPSDIQFWKDKYTADKSATIKECMAEPPFCYNPADTISHFGLSNLMKRSDNYVNSYRYSQKIIRSYNFTTPTSALSLIRN